MILVPRNNTTIVKVMLVILEAQHITVKGS